MKTVSLDLLSQVVGTYDQTKTTIQGRVSQKTVSGMTVLSPPLTKFIDFATDTGGLVPTSAMHATPNGNLFICGTVSAGIIPILLYEFNYTTGVHTYKGRINMTTPNSAATTHTIRSIRAIDTGVTGWKIFLTTVGTVTINAGLFMLNKIDKADFVTVSFPTIPFATADDQKAVYFLQDPSNIGVGQLNIAAAGSILDTATNKIYVHNGSAATHQYYVYNTNTTPTYPTAAVTVNVATPGVVSHAGHSYVANTPVTFTAGSLPTGLTVGTVYFVKNPVAGVSYELSATSGGASINTTGSSSVGAYIGRAFGTCDSNFAFKTGNLPALTGTLLLTDTERKVTPVAAPLNGPTLNGNSCAFLCTSTNLYLGLLSELTAGTTTWPSLTTSNILGTTNQIVAPTASNAGWSDAYDSAIYLTNVNKFVMKKVQNNVIDRMFGSLNNKYYETTTTDLVDIDLAVYTLFDNEGGWMFLGGSTAGQRVIVCTDIRSSEAADYSYIVSKVIDIPNSQIQSLSIIRQYALNTGAVLVQYRTSGFGSISGGWIDLPETNDLSSIATPSDQIQFKLLFQLLTSAVVSPAQINNAYLNVTSNSETSDYWEYSHDNSSSSSPTRVAFRLKTAYATSVPTLYFRAYDLSNTLLNNHNTSANPSYFEYSTNDGASWLPLGTIPNTVGTLVRYNFLSPPGVKVRPGLRES